MMVGVMETISNFTGFEVFLLIMVTLYSIIAVVAFFWLRGK